MVNEKHNKATMVMVIILFVKCNKSYGEIVMSISNDSAIELLRVKNIYESDSETSKFTRYANQFASNGHDENIISNNILKSLDQISKFYPRKKLNTPQQDYLFSETSSQINCDKKLKNENQTSIVLSQFDKNNSIIPNMTIISRLPILLRFGYIDSLLSGNSKLNNKFKIKTIASNKMYDDIGHFKQQLRFKRQDNALCITKKQNPRDNFFTNKFKNGKEDDGVKPTLGVLKVRDNLRNEHIPLESCQMNSQKKDTLVHNWKKGIPFQPRSKFMMSIREKKIKDKRERDAVTKDQNFAINIKHKSKRTRLLNNREKNTKINKLLKGAMHINTIRAKRVEMEPQESMESSWNALDKSFRLNKINETLYPTIGLNIWNQLTIFTPYDLISNHHSDSISKQHYQRDIDMGQDSQTNGQLDNANNYLTPNYFSNSSKATITKQIIREKTNAINMGDIFQTPVLQTIKYKLHTQTVIQTDYLPGFNDVDNSNNNISLRIMPYAPSETHNQTLIQSKKKDPLEKYLKVKKKKNTIHHTKAKISKVFVTQYKKPTKHSKIQKTQVNVKQSRITRLYMKMFSTKKSKTNKASKKRKSKLRKKGNSKKAVRGIKTLEHRINVNDITLHNVHRTSSNLKKAKWYKTSSKKKKSNQATPSKRAKHLLNKKHRKSGGKSIKRVNRNTANKNKKPAMYINRRSTFYHVRMGVSESDVVKPLNLTNRDTEIQMRNYNQRAGGIFNSYVNFWNNNNNHYYYISSAITDRNVVNNLIVIDFDTSPPTTSTESTTLSSGKTTTPPSTLCQDIIHPTVYFIKKKAVTDYSIVVAAIVMIALALIVCCCCACAPVIILRRRNKKNKNKNDISNKKCNTA